MDGVIVNSEELWRTVEGPIFQELMPRWISKNQEEIVGMGVEDVYRYFVLNYGLSLSQEKFLDSCEKVAIELYDHRVSLAEGLLPFLEELRETKIPLGLASSSPQRWIQRVLKRFDLAHYFSSVLSAEDVQNRTKPAPDLYLESARRLNARPADCLAVEDSSIGISAAKSAGFYCLGFRNRANAAQDFSRADKVIGGFGEMMGLFKKRNEPIVEEG